LGPRSHTDRLWQPATTEIKNEWLSTDIKTGATPAAREFSIHFVAVKTYPTAETSIEIDEIEISTDDECSEFKYARNVSYFICHCHVKTNLSLLMK